MLAGVGQALLDRAVERVAGHGAQLLQRLRPRARLVAHFHVHARLAGTLHQRFHALARIDAPLAAQRVQRLTQIPHGSLGFIANRARGLPRLFRI